MAIYCSLDTVWLKPVGRPQHQLDYLLADQFAEAEEQLVRLITREIKFESPLIDC